MKSVVGGFLGCAIAGHMASAIAEEIVITQKNLQFSPTIKVIKPDDVISFKNEDTVIHNIISLTKDFEFDLGKVKPGMIKNLQFNKEGVVDIECTVHPKMKMTLFIQE